MPKEQVIIIGGGPAGVACAVQLKRYGIDPLIIEKEAIGGLIKNAWRIDNYPGSPDGISGAGMVEKLQAHLKRFDIRYSISDIRYTNHIDGAFLLESNTKKFRCNYLVIATGTKAIPHFEDITDRISDQILSEVYAIRDVKRKNIAIIGAGDAAFDYAMTLSAHNDVHIFNRGTELKCIPALHDIAVKQENIAYTENSLLMALRVKEGRLFPIFNDPENNPEYSFDYIIFATGREPDLHCFSDDLKNKLVQLEQQGLLYVIGDVKNGMVRQSSVAIGDGIRAAMAIKDRIRDESDQQDTRT